MTDDSDFVRVIKVLGCWHCDAMRRSTERRIKTNWDRMTPAAKIVPYGRPFESRAKEMGRDPILTGGTYYPRLWNGKTQKKRPARRRLDAGSETDLKLTRTSNPGT